MTNFELVLNNLGIHSWTYLKHFNPFGRIFSMSQIPSASKSQKVPFDP